MKTKLLAVLLLAGASAFAAPRVVVGVGFGGYGYRHAYPAYRAYVPAPVVAYAAPPAYYAPPVPGPGYAWIDGYSYPVGAGSGWRAGYWARRPFAGAAWVGPRNFGGRYYAGHWRR